MTVAVAVNKRFLDTSAAQSARDWDQLLEYQVDLLFADELTFLRSSPEWAAARRVVDAGCGNGYYLSKLAAYFPDKAYLGIDISPQMIAAAAARHQGIEFRTGDFFTADAPNADVVVMRFLVQHLGDFGSVLRRTRRLLRPGGALIVIEADLSRSAILPLPPAFHRMLLAYGRASAADGGVKAMLLSDIERLVASTGEDWAVDQHQVMTPRIGPFADSKLLQVFLRWVDLAERSAMFVFDFAGVRDELAAWGMEPASFVNLATRIFVLKPPAAA